MSLDFLEILGRRKKIKYHKVGSGQIWPPHLWQPWEWEDLSIFSRPIYVSALSSREMWFTQTWGPVQSWARGPTPSLCIISEMKAKARYWSKIAIFHTSLNYLHSRLPLRRSPSEYSYTIWYGKTRMRLYPTVKKFWGYEYTISYRIDYRIVYGYENITLCCA